MRRLHPPVVVILVEVKLLGPVALIVCLVDYVQADAVAKLIEIRNIRVVARAHCVEIVLPDQNEVRQDSLVIHNGSGHRVGLMPVHAVESYRLAVQKDTVVPDADLSQADSLVDDLVRGLHYELV